MPETLVETSEFVGSVQVPLGGEARTAASLKPAYQTLTNRCRWLYDRAAAIFKSASPTPEGVETAVGGASYWSTYESTYWLKSTASGNTGWVRVLANGDNETLLCDWRGGSDRTVAFRMTKATVTSTARNYVTLSVDSTAPVTDTGVTLYGADDATYPGQIRLNPANPDGDALVVDNDGPAIYPVGNWALGTVANPWATIAAAYLHVDGTGGILVDTGSVTVADGNVVISTGDVTATAGDITATAGRIIAGSTVEGEIKPDAYAWIALPAAASHAGEMIRTASAPYDVLFSDGTQWRSMTRPTRLAIMTDADRAAGDYLTANLVVLPDGVATVNRNCAVPSSGMIEGDVFEIRNDDDVAYLTVTGLLSGSIQFRNCTDSYSSVRCRFDGTHWSLLSRSVGENAPP